MIASTQTNHPMGTLKGVKHQSPIEYACARLKAAGMRITQPRISILRALINRSVPASIEQIHSDLPPDTCDLVTVYRCLSVFEDIGLVRLGYFHNGASVYQLTLNSEVTPYHIITKGEHKVAELDAESSAELREVITRIENRLRENGYEKVSHILEFFVSAATPESPVDHRAEAPVIPAVLQMRANSQVIVEQ